jgi:hypothetical protein
MQDLPPIAHAASQQESSALGGQASAAWTKVTLGFAIWSCIDLQEAFDSQAMLKMEGKILSGLPRIEGKTTQRDTWVHVIKTNGDTWKMGASWLCSFSNFLPLYIKRLSRARIPFPAPKDEITEIINQRGVSCIQCSVSRSPNWGWSWELRTKMIDLKMPGHQTNLWVATSLWSWFL